MTPVSGKRVGVQIGLDDDQRALRDSARSLLDAQSPLSLAREAYDDPDRWRPLWDAIVEVGWPGVLSVGDTADVMNLVVLLEQAGAALVPAPLVSSAGLAAGALRAAGEAAAPLLDEIANGTIATLLTGDEALPGPGLSCAGGRITGRVAQVRDATRAEVFVALARGGAGREHLVAFRAGDGIEVSPAEAIDPSQPVAAVTVDAEPVICEPVETAAALTVPLVAAAAELVGVGDRAVTMAVEHAKTREQFGQPIGAFQAVKHRLADAYVAVERARSLTYLAASVTGDPGQAWRDALLAKAAASDAAMGAARACVATHGAIAQTWEHDAHLLVRRAWQSGALLGEPEALYAAAGRDYVAASA